MCKGFRSSQLSESEIGYDYGNSDIKDTTSGRTLNLHRINSAESSDAAVDFSSFIVMLRCC